MNAPAELTHLVPEIHLRPVPAALIRRIADDNELPRDTYLGQVIEVSGNGRLTMVKVRFRTAGVLSFVADKVQLEVLRQA